MNLILRNWNEMGVFLSYQPAYLRAWTNGKCLATKHHQTLFGDQTFYRLDTLFDAVWSCLIVFDRVWSCLVVFDNNFRAIKHSIENFEHFFCSRVWWAIFCSFGQPRIKHVWSRHAYHACSAACINCLICVWSQNNVWWCLVAKHFSFVQALTSNSLL